MSSRRKIRDHPRSLDVFAGSLAGATATVITHPLEVLQTRLQSSTFGFKKVPAVAMPLFVLERNANLTMCASVAPPRTTNIFSYAKGMIENEGYSLFSRGLLANVAAFSLSRGIYFSLYSSSKKFLRDKRGENKTESTPIHVCSAAFAGFVTCTLTNPIWLLKTRLQLDSRPSGNSPKLSTMLVTIYRKEGIQAFYGGLTASYLGIVETAIHFAIYEHLKSTILQRRKSNLGCETAFHVSDCMVAAAVSKTIATVLAYPHEVIRTRMREQNQGKSFLRLIRTIMNKEGWQGFYGGLGTHLFRQVPNTAIVFLTYESVIYFGMEFLKTRN